MAERSNSECERGNQRRNLPFECGFVIELCTEFLYRQYGEMSGTLYLAGNYKN